MERRRARDMSGNGRENLENRRSTTAFKKAHKKLYGLLLHANGRVDDVGALLFWGVVLFVVGLCVSIHLGWLDEVLGVSLAAFRGAMTYVVISIAALVAFVKCVDAAKRRTYERVKPGIFRQLDHEGMSVLTLLAEIADHKPLKEIAKMLAKDESILPADESDAAKHSEDEDRETECGGGGSGTRVETGPEPQDVPPAGVAGQPQRLPMLLIVVASYFILSGAIGLAWPLLDLRYGSEEYSRKKAEARSRYEAKSDAYKVGHKAGGWTRWLAFNVAFIAGGLGLMFRKAWARTLMLVVLPISAFYGAFSFAFGFSKGSPAGTDYAISFAVVGLWNGLFMLYLGRRHTKAILVSGGESAGEQQPRSSSDESRTETASSTPARKKREPGKRGLSRIRGRWLQRLRGGVSDEAILAQLKDLSKRKGNWLHSLLLLGITVLLFASLGWSDTPLLDVLIIVGVLLIHELGHLVGMYVSGYRNVKMFFVPFFGAAVSGDNLTAPGWTKAIVTLLGPVPGIMLGIAVGVVSTGAQSTFWAQVAKALIFINALNLLPLFPLDGGRFLQEVLFCRNRYLEVVFKVLAGVMIILLGIALKSWMLAVVGLSVVVSVGYSFKVASVAIKLREEIGQPEVATVHDLPPETTAGLIASVRLAFPDLSKPKALAGALRSVWERAHARPPGAAATVAFLLAYVVLVTTAVGGGIGGIERAPSDAWPEKIDAARNAFMAARYTDAEGKALDALAIAEESGPEDHRVAMSLHLLATIYDHQTRYGEAKPLLDRALGIYTASFGGRHKSVAAVLTSKAMVHYRTAELDEAEALLNRAAKLFTDAREVHAIPAYLARVYRHRGKHALAESLLQDSLAQDMRKLGSEHTVVEAEQYSLALVYTDLGKYVEAETLYKQALVAAEKGLGPEHPYVGTLLADLGALYASWGRCEEARPLCVRSMAIFEAVFPSDHPRLANSQFALAKLLHAEGKKAEAARVLRAALAAVEKTRGPAHPFVAAMLHELGRILAGEGKYEESHSAHMRARAIIEQAAKHVHPMIPDIVSGLAEASSGLGRDSVAESCFREAIICYMVSFPHKRRQLAGTLDRYAAHLRSRGKQREASRLQARATAVRAGRGADALLSSVRTDEAVTPSADLRSGKAADVGLPVTGARERGKEPGGEAQDYDDRKIIEASLALHDDPGNAYEHYMDRGLAYKRKDMYEKAIADFDRAIKLDPENHRAYGLRASTYRDIGEYEKAIADCTREVEAYGRSRPHDHYRRGKVYYLMGEFGLAIRDFSAAIGGRSDYSCAYEYRGLCHQHRGDHEKALVDLNKAIKVEKDNYSAYWWRAALYAEMGKLSLALADHNTWVENACCEHHKYGPRGRFYLYRMKDYGKASADFRAWTKLAPQDAHAAIWLHFALCMAGKDGTAELASLAKNLNRNEWPYPAVDFYLGRMTPEALLASTAGATKREKAERKCEALFFIGKFHALWDEKKEAKSFFKRCLETGVRGRAEYGAAREELRMLGE